MEGTAAIKVMCSDRCHIVSEETGKSFAVSWRGADTFFCIGGADTFLIEGGVELPATLSFLKNGFVRLNVDLEGTRFGILMKDTASLLSKFSMYVKSGDDYLGRVIAIDPSA